MTCAAVSEFVDAAARASFSALKGDTVTGQGGIATQVSLSHSRPSQQEPEAQEPPIGAQLGQTPPEHGEPLQHGYSGSQAPPAGTHMSPVQTLSVQVSPEQQSVSFVQLVPVGWQHAFTLRLERTARVVPWAPPLTYQHL